MRARRSGSSSSSAIAAARPCESPGVDEHAGFLGQLLRDPADTARDHRDARRERLQHRQWVVVGPRRVNVEVGSTKPLRNLLPSLEAAPSAASRLRSAPRAPPSPSATASSRRSRSSSSALRRVSKSLYGFVRAPWAANTTTGSSRSVAALRSEELDVDAVRDHACGGNRRREHRALRALQQPRRRADDVEPRALVERCLSLPVLSRPVDAQRGIGVEMRARSAPLEPALGVERVRAVARCRAIRRAWSRRSAVAPRARAARAGRSSRRGGCGDAGRRAARQAARARDARPGSESPRDRERRRAGRQDRASARERRERPVADLHDAVLPAPRVSPRRAHASCPRCPVRAVQTRARRPRRHRRCRRS